MQAFRGVISWVVLISFLAFMQVSAVEVLHPVEEAPEPAEQARARGHVQLHRLDEPLFHSAKPCPDEGDHRHQCIHLFPLALAEPPLKEGAVRSVPWSFPALEREGRQPRTYHIPRGPPRV